MPDAPKEFRLPEDRRVRNTDNNLSGFYFCNDDREENPESGTYDIGQYLAKVDHGVTELLELAFVDTKDSSLLFSAASSGDINAAKQAFRTLFMSSAYVSKRIFIRNFDLDPAHLELVVKSAVYGFLAKVRLGGLNEGGTSFHNAFTRISGPEPKVPDDFANNMAEGMCACLRSWSAPRANRSAEIRYQFNEELQRVANPNAGDAEE
ncbi:MAG: hypothetical protein WC269_04175 [Candidatus Gracilibacteria bacterium]|jgi:hypothetical protein